jgi:diadenosine tetraphosphatase ApaH/serine/threonine PP2A family protein phosphatase
MRIAIISDIHANLEALEAVLASIGPADRFICLGDIVGYGPDPNECVERVRILPGLVCVAGNHDLAAVGKYDHDWFNAHARAAIEWTQQHLSQSSRQLLEQLPPTAQMEELTLVHGALPEPMDYITGPAEALSTFQTMPTSVCLIGHTHIAEYYWVPVPAGKPASLGDVEHEYLTDGGSIALEPESAYVINCGSVGQPRDGNPDAACGIFDDERRTIEVRRVPYPIEQVQRKMREADLPFLLIERLSYGR